MTVFRSTVLTALSLFSTVSFADDWPQWGGPQRDLVWRETGIVETLPVDADGKLPRVWSAPIGEGYAGPAVANGRVFVTDRIVDESLERVLCFDAETGKLLWNHDYLARYTVSYPAGPRSTPVVDGDRVYTIGAMGHMFCFNAESGKVLWKRNFVDDFGTDLPTWGMAASPLVDGDRWMIRRSVTRRRWFSSSEGSDSSSCGIPRQFRQSTRPTENLSGKSLTGSGRV
jgi:outer membrane protein assembly factor BamB